MSEEPSSGRMFIVALAAVTAIGPLAIHLFLPALPAVGLDFGIDAAAAQLAFSVTLLTMAVATLVYGPLSDRFGRRPVLVGGLVLFVVLLGVAVLANPAKTRRSRAMAFSRGAKVALRRTLMAAKGAG